MLITASENHTLDTLLELLCTNLQLTESQDLRARGHYGAVSRWLAADGSFLRVYSPHIYPQGSQRRRMRYCPHSPSEITASPSTS